MNKKAQIEKATTFPVFIIILLITAGFLIISSALSINSPVQTEIADPNLASSIDELLIQPIEIQIGEQKEKTIVIDAIGKLDYNFQSLSNPNSVYFYLKDFLTEEKNCIILYKEHEHSWPTGIIEIDDLPRMRIMSPEKVQGQLTKMQFFQNEKPIIIYSYYGRCDH